MDVFVAVVVFVRVVAVYLGRHPEDGEAVVRDRFVVVAQDARGARVAHRVVFEDSAGADALAARVRAAGRALDLAHWTPTDPEYGSEAYQADEADLVAKEQADEEAGLDYADPWA